VASSLAVFEAEIRVKSTHLIKSCLKTRKKEKIWKSNKFFYINLHLIDGLGNRNGFHSLLSRADATGSVDIIDGF